MIFTVHLNITRKPHRRTNTRPPPSPLYPSYRRDNSRLQPFSFSFSFPFRIYTFANTRASIRVQAHHQRISSAARTSGRRRSGATHGREIYIRWRIEARGREREREGTQRESQWYSTTRHGTTVAVAVAPRTATQLRRCSLRYLGRIIFAYDVRARGDSPGDNFAR